MKANTRCAVGTRNFAADRHAFIELITATRSWRGSPEWAAEGQNCKTGAPARQAGGGGVLNLKTFYIIHVLDANKAIFRNR